MILEVPAKPQSVPTVEPAAVPDARAPRAHSGDALRSSWAEFFAQDNEASIYQHPDLVYSEHAQRHGSPRIHAQSIEGGVESIAVLSSYRHKVRPVPGTSLSVSLRGLKLVGNCLIGDNGPTAAGNFLAAGEEWLRTGAADCICVEELETDSALWQALHTEARRKRRGCVTLIKPVEPQPHWFIDFPQKAEDYWLKFSSKTRSNYRRKVKHLQCTMEAYTEPQDVEKFLTKAQVVSAKSWQSRRLGGLRIQTTPAAIAYWQSVARLGGMRSYVMEQNGQPIAFLLSVQWNGRFIYEEPAYDPTFADSSPGTVLLMRVIDDLIARNTPNVLDFGFGHAEYKKIFGTRMSHSGPVLLVRRAWKPAAVMGMEKLRRHAGATVREALRDSGLLNAVRRMYRR